MAFILHSRGGVELARSDAIHLPSSHPRPKVPLYWVNKHMLLGLFVVQSLCESTK